MKTAGDNWEAEDRWDPWRVTVKDHGGPVRVDEGTPDPSFRPRPIGFAPIKPPVRGDVPRHEEECPLNVWWRESHAGPPPRCTCPPIEEPPC